VNKIVAALPVGSKSNKSYVNKVAYIYCVTKFNKKISTLYLLVEIFLLFTRFYQNVNKVFFVPAQSLQYLKHNIKHHVSYFNPRVIKVGVKTTVTLVICNYCNEICDVNLKFQSLLVEPVRLVSVI
jgi:hypothetical protein